MTSGGSGDERDCRGKLDNMDADVLSGADTNRTQNSQSRPKKKKKGFPKQTPSQVLISALEHRGYTVDIPEAPKYTRDLSYTDPRRIDPHSPSLKSHQWGDRPPSTVVTLPTILAKYILFLDDYPALSQRSRRGNLRDENAQNEAILRVFDRRTLEFLSRKGYSPSDVMVWAWIITAQRSSQAALRLGAFEDLLAGSKNRVPLFIFLFTLRRRNLNAGALRVLLLQIWRALGSNQPQEAASEDGLTEKSHQDSDTPHHSWKLSGDESSIMILIVRLLRHAREVWPQALLSIATMMTTHIGSTARHSSDPKFNAKKIQRLTFIYNRGLKLLSLPCRPNPYHSVSVQQQAQFRLLRRMTEFSPPLAVTREGYRAITRVQLAHKKTAAEQQWAKFKAVSWPPWKEEKLGIDSERGNEGGKSRAMESMTQMVTGGYSHGRWEQVATVFAGWDIDGSPTIQRRTSLPKPNAFRNGDSTKYRNHDLWAARIRATRTKKEAWACFLSYEDRYPPHQEVYYAMCEKIAHREKTLDEFLDGEDAALPGDGKEVFPEPTSPRDVIYTRSEPPSLDVLFDQMQSHGIRPSGRFLAFLLSEAKCFKSGMNYLRNSDLSPKEIEYLCTVSPQGDNEVGGTVGDIPEYLFASFIRFLCNASKLEANSEESNIHFDEVFPIFCSEKSSIEKSVLMRRPRPSSPTNLHRHEALKRAAMAMKARKPRYGPPWHYLLSRLAADRISSGKHGIYISLERTLAWGEITEVLRWMDEVDLDLDIQGFQIICSAFERAVLSGRRDISGAENGLAAIGGAHETFEDFVHAGLMLLKGHFDRLVLPETRTVNMDSGSSTFGPGQPLIDPSCLLPTMLEIPSPASLHAFIRALGVTEDFEGLLYLLRWMSRFAPELKKAADERLGGKRLMRRAIVAIRVFLENNWDKELLPPSSPSSDSAESGKAKPSKEGDMKEWEKALGARDEGEESTPPTPPPTFSDPYQKEAYDIIESTEIWGPWPSDEEVASYIAHWKYNKNTSTVS